MVRQERWRREEGRPDITHQEKPAMTKQYHRDCPCADYPPSCTDGVPVFSPRFPRKGPLSDSLEQAWDANDLNDPRNERRLWGRTSG